MIQETMPDECTLEEPVEAAVHEVVVPRNVAHRLLSGTSTLGLAVMIERGLGFVANILAARLGGASTFGSYSLAITTANSIGTYAAGGIGATATRFSGQYPIGTRGYSTLAKALLLISFASAMTAALALWLGAAPLARMLHKESLTGLLSWAALSAAGIIVLECCRGFLIGQHRLLALLVLSSCAGLGMVALIPAAAHLGPVAMILSQGGVALGSVGICMLLFRQLRLASPVAIADPEPFLPMLKRVWSFGFVQLAGIVVFNAAGWWLTSLIARGDPLMIQMGFFAISLQLRNMVGMVPSLLSQSSYALMAANQHGDERTPDRVVAVCTGVTTLVAFLLAGAVTLVLPWGLPLLYGKSYAGAEGAAALALANAVIQMGNSPAGARLSILSIRATGVINTVWAVAVAGLATLFLAGGGNALKGAAIYLAAHVLSATLVFATLRARRNLPSGIVLVFGIGSGASLLLSVLAVLRSSDPHASLMLTAIMLAVFVAGTVLLIRTGRRHGLLPSGAVFRKLYETGFARISRAAGV